MRENWAAGCHVSIHLYPSLLPCVCTSSLFTNLPYEIADRVWHCLPCLQGDKWTHVEGVRKPLAHSLVIWSPVEVPSIQAWETYVPGVKCGDFVEMIFVSLRSLFEVFLSLLVLNKTKKSGKMEVLG